MELEATVEKLNLRKNVDTSLGFAWGVGNELAFYQDEDVTVKTKIVPTKKKQLVEFYSWNLAEKSEIQFYEEFAKTYRTFHQEVKDIYNHEGGDEDRKIEMSRSVKKANEQYQHLIKQASKNSAPGSVQKDEFLIHYFTWKLASIFYLNEAKDFSKTQEFCRWSKQYADVFDITDHGKIVDWKVLYNYLSFGELDDTIFILKNILASKELAGHEAIVYEIIQFLSNKIKFYKGDNCLIQEKSQFEDYFRQSKEEAEKIASRYQDRITNGGLATLLKIISGDLETIEQVCEKDWKKLFNLIFLFHYPFINKEILSSSLKRACPAEFLNESSRTLIDIVFHNRAFKFIEMIKIHYPLWMTFHICDLLFYFKNVPELVEEEMYDERTFMQRLQQEYLEDLSNIKASCYLVKYYIISDKNYSNLANLDDPATKELIERVYYHTLPEITPASLKSILKDLDDPLFQEAPDLAASIRKTVLKMRVSQLRTYSPQTLSVVTEMLQILDRIGEFEMIDNYAIFLVKEAEKQKEYVKDVLLPLIKILKKENSVSLANSHGLHYLENYAEFKDVVNNIDRCSIDSLLDSKTRLIGAIQDDNVQIWMQISILELALPLFDREESVFTVDEVHTIMSKLNDFEEQLTFEEVPNLASTTKMIKRLKFSLLKCLSKSHLTAEALKNFA